jgi:hypothetical protein
MGGGLMQLVAYGAQDIYLTGNPQITYFKVVYRRHTNFAMETIEQTFNGTADFGNKVSATISRNGDLISGMYVRATLPSNAATERWTENVGHYLIKEVCVEIGGQEIDRHYSDWLEIWASLTVPSSQKCGYNAMIGQGPLDAIGQPTNAQRLSNADTHEIYIPLQFWFCRNVGLALPLIALQYHEVKVCVEFETLTNLSMNAAGDKDTATTASLTDVGLWVDYIYLDTDERRRFAQVSHEYLIEQLQYSGAMTTTSAAQNCFTLHFNHPVKAMFWVTRDTASEDANQWNNFTTTQADDTTTAITNFDTTGADTLLPGLAVVTGMTDDVITTGADHGLVTGDRIVVTTVGSATELVAGQSYYVIRVDDNEFSLALSSGGAVFAITNSGVVLEYYTVTTTTIANISSSKYFKTGGELPGEYVNPTSSALLKLNGHDRFASQRGSYFSLVQPKNHFTSTPCCPINVYSFALKPEEHQPSGTCNFSRIDNAQLCVTTAVLGGTANTHIYVINYNVLRIMSGMGGLAYSN